MNPCLRLAILTTTALGALSTVPSRAADGMLVRDQAPVALSGTDRWRLKPAEPITTGAMGHGPSRAASDIPEARRAVRIVYPGLSAAR